MGSEASRVSSSYRTDIWGYDMTSHPDPTIIRIERVKKGTVFLYKDGTIRAHWDVHGDETWKNVYNQPLSECEQEFNDMIERWRE